MPNLTLQLARTANEELASATVESAPSGISSLGINLKGFLFQLITFLIVLLILRRYVFPKLVETLEKRRQTLEQSLVQAKETEEVLARAETKAEEILSKARAQADEALAEAKKIAEANIADAESAASQRAAHIVKEAEAHLDQERAQMREELGKELAQLVSTATEKIIRQKIDEPADRQLIERYLKELA